MQDEENDDDELEQDGLVVEDENDGIQRTEI